MRAIGSPRKRLSPSRHQRLLGLLMGDDDLPYKEIAEQLNMPIGSIGPTRGRCLEQLRQILEEMQLAPASPKDSFAARLHRVDLHLVAVGAGAVVVRPCAVVTAERVREAARTVEAERVALLGDGRVVVGGRVVDEGGRVAGGPRDVVGPVVVPLARSASTKRYVVPFTTLVMAMMGSLALLVDMVRSPPEHAWRRALFLVEYVLGCMVQAPCVAL